MGSQIMAIGVALRRNCAEGTATTNLTLPPEVLLPHQGIYKIFSTFNSPSPSLNTTSSALFCLQNFSSVHQANFTYSMDDITETAYLKIEFGPASFWIDPESPMKKGGHHIRMIFSCIDYL